jgi:hypothetical protein
VRSQDLLNDERRTADCSFVGCHGRAVWHGDTGRCWDVSYFDTKHFMSVIDLTWLSCSYPARVTFMDCIARE